MAEHPIHAQRRPPQIHQRRLDDAGRRGTPDVVEIASILVQARPERLDEAARAIEALPGAQIYSRDPKGKLVVVIEAAGRRQPSARRSTPFRCCRTC